MRKGWIVWAAVCAVVVGNVASAEEVSRRPYVDTDAHVSAKLREAVREAVELGDPGDWQQFDADQSDMEILDKVSQLIEANCFEPRMIIPLRFGTCGLRVADTCVELGRIVARPIDNCTVTTSR